MPVDRAGFGKTIQALRKHASMTQGEVASRVGVTDKAVSKWERGEALPAAESFAALGKALNVPALVLFEAMEPESEQAHAVRPLPQAALLPLGIEPKGFERTRLLIRRPYMDTLQKLSRTPPFLFERLYLQPSHAGRPLLVRQTQNNIKIHVYAVMRVQAHVSEAHVISRSQYDDLVGFADDSLAPFASEVWMFSRDGQMAACELFEFFPYTAVLTVFHAPGEQPSIPAHIKVVRRLEEDRHFDPLYMARALAQGKL